MSQNFQFLDDESLTSNLNDDQAEKILKWLELVATDLPSELERMLSFAKFYNKNISEIDQETDLGAFLELFNIFLDSPNMDMDTLNFTANFILTKGEIDEPQSEKITN